MAGARRDRTMCIVFYAEWPDVVKMRKSGLYDRQAIARRLPVLETSEISGGRHACHLRSNLSVWLPSGSARRAERMGRAILTVSTYPPRPHPRISRYRAPDRMTLRTERVSLGIEVVALVAI